MSNNDLRIIKTHKALQKTLLTLLEHTNFIGITVNDLCKQAQISRATFYTHFLDKYDFLQYFLKSSSLDFADCNFRNFEKINQFFCENKAVIKHLFSDADSETLKIVFEFIISVLNIYTDKSNAKSDSKYIVLSNILVGGIISYIYWQIDNRFPFEIEVINTHLCDIIKLLKEF